MLFYTIDTAPTRVKFFFKKKTLIVKLKKLRLELWRHSNIWSTYGYFVERASHHRDEHVEKDDDRSPVVDAEHDVADRLRKTTLKTLSEFNGLGVFQTEHCPVDRSKRIFEAGLKEVRANMQEIIQSDAKRAKSSEISSGHNAPSNI